MILDIFSQDAFGAVELTNAINKLPFIPGRVGQLGIFANRGVATTAVSIEEREGVLYMVPTSQRGAPGTQNKTGKRTLRKLAIPHLQVNDTILADEVQNVRSFGSENELQSLQMVVNQRLETMAQSLDVTIEHLRLGAIKGQILDSDGSTVIYNLFTEFGVSQEPEVDFDLDNANPAAGALRKKCASVIRKIANNLGAAPLTRVHALCGDNFFDDLVAHPEVRETYLNQSQASELREGYVYGTLNFGGVTFENYRGSVGGTSFIDTDKCHLFPVGVPGLFMNFFGPADYAERVNSIGLPRYAKQAADPMFNKFVSLEAQSNPLPICTRPKVLMQGKRT
jgi:hypothetical protein